MCISFCSEVLSCVVHRAITEVAALPQEHICSRVEEGAGASQQMGTGERDRPWICAAVKRRDNFHRVEGEKEEGSLPPLVETLWKLKQAEQSLLLTPRNKLKQIRETNCRIDGVRRIWQTKQMEDRLLHYSSSEGIKSLVGLLNIFYQSWLSF